MRFHSTRGSRAPTSARQALLQGTAPDGGLFVPEQLPAMNHIPLGSGSYQDLAAGLLQAFFGELGAEAIRDAVHQAYRTFDSPGVCPLVPVGDAFVLELFHGPTGAFKDIALQLLPRLMAKAREQDNPALRYIVLTATSGDTGSAAMQGFQDIPGFSVLVYYPDSGISRVQQAQMTRLPGDNLQAVAIRGNFDDAQAAVKAAFMAGKGLLPPGLMLASANSINIGRLIPQMVYYIKACLELQARHGIPPGQAVDFIVPTGNFGDILAGFLAKGMGWPIGRLVCASNDNRVLTDFLHTGVYDRNRPLASSLSPSMDILVSSNLERLLYHALHQDGNQVKALMESLASRGRYQLPAGALARIQADFLPASVTDRETLAGIRAVYQAHRYLMDPHTAVAWQARKALAGSNNPQVVLATASPFKFPETVLKALGQPVPGDLNLLLPRLQDLTGQAIPPALAGLLECPVRHRAVIDKGDILQDVKERLAQW